MQWLKSAILTVAHKCHAKIVIFFFPFSDFFSDFFCDFLATS